MPVNETRCLQPDHKDSSKDICKVVFRKLMLLFMRPPLRFS